VSETRPLQLGVGSLFDGKPTAATADADRAGALRAEIRDTLQRTGDERYSQLAGQVHDAGEESLADLLVDVNQAEIARDVREIRDIDAAQRRIANGSYGICLDCDESIVRERLEAYPTAKRCLKCQQKHERTQATARPASL
jgi:DnaK suppressor protein